MKKWPTKIAVSVNIQAEVTGTAYEDGSFAALETNLIGPAQVRGMVMGFDEEAKATLQSFSEPFVDAAALNAMERMKDKLVAKINATGGEAEYVTEPGIEDFADKTKLN